MKFSVDLSKNRLSDRRLTKIFRNFLEHHIKTFANLFSSRGFLFWGKKGPIKKSRIETDKNGHQRTKADMKILRN